MSRQRPIQQSDLVFRMLVCVYLSLWLAFVVDQARADTDTITFKVYSDPECTTIFRGRSGDAIKLSSSCITYSYTGSNGISNTDSADKFNCCENFIELTQYPSSYLCGTRGAGESLYKVIGTQCHYVNTSYGDTWQKLLNYDERCSQRYNYTGSFGSNITEDQCSDPAFLPEILGTWVIDGNLQLQGMNEQSSSSPFRKPIEAVRVILFAGVLLLFWEIKLIGFMMHLYKLCISTS